MFVFFYTVIVMFHCEHINDITILDVYNALLLQQLVDVII